jgi:alpha-galactosidase
MDRRHFVRTAGFSFCAILISRRLRASPEGAYSGDGMTHPDEISVTSESGTFPLRSVDGTIWEERDVRVGLFPSGNALAVDVQSPAEYLKFVTMKWRLPRNSSAKCLGDQWERSYGDLHWGMVDEQRIMPWYFMEYDGNITNGYGVKTGSRSLCFWQAGTGNIVLNLDLRSGGDGVRLGDRTLRAAEIVVQRGIEGDSPYISTRKFCALMCDSPRLPKEPVYGINDWYFTYGNNSAELILEHASLTAGLAAQNTNKPFCVIDAGWAIEAPGLSRGCWADNFSTPNHYFGDMGKLAAKIKDLGMRPGIWVRPLCGSLNDNPARLMPKIPRMDSPNAPFLDPTIPENMDRITQYFELYRSWGYELVKHDFTTADLLGKWGFKMIESRDVTFGNWRFHDNTRTNAEIMLDLYKAIREASGDTYLIGCNTVSHLSAGLFELQRIGDDTSGKEWERTRRMGVNTLGFRLPQHKSFYSADGDCVGLTTQVPWEKNRQWMQLVAETGTPLFISAQKEAVGETQKAFIKHSFSTASRTVPDAEPLDWLENQTPSIWRLMGRQVEFDWS